MGKPRGTQELRTILAAWHYGCKVEQEAGWWFYHQFFWSCLFSHVSRELCSSSPPPQLQWLHCPLESLILLLFLLYQASFRPVAPWEEQRRDVTLALLLLDLTSITISTSSAHPSGHHLPKPWCKEALGSGQRGGIFLQWHWCSGEVQSLALWHLVNCVVLLLFCCLYLICPLISFYGCSV